MRISLLAIGVLSIASGLVVALLRRELYDLAGIEHPAVPLPLQAAGLLIALLGTGLWMAARRPYEYRGFVLVSCAANGLLVAAWAYNIVTLKLPAYCSVIALVQFALFVLLGRVSRALYQVDLNFDVRPIAETTVGHALLPRWLFRNAWAALVLAIMAPAAWSTLPAVRQIHGWWRTPSPLRLVPVAANLPAAADVPTPLKTVDAFPHLRFNDPIFITPLADGTGRLLVAERPGRVYAFDNSPTASETTLWLDITDRVIDNQGTGEDGLSGVALHPHFADAASPHCGELFLHYTAMVDGRRSIRISKFRVPAGSDIVDPNSEVVLIDQPDQNPSHNGGSILFGPDGFLYITIGDDDQRHPNPYAQYIDRDLFSGVLRIDVDCRGGDVSHAPPRQPNTGRTAGYYIPNDNPFVGTPNALEEFYAIGLRNAWRASFDRKTGKYWVSDVGERLREEVNIVENGSNCGWAYVEGSVWSNSHDPKALGRPDLYLGKETWPVFEYERDAMNHCIIGGYVYRGIQFPELVGKYVYADTSGRIYALEVDEQDKVVANRLIAVIENGGHNAVSFGEDVDGELFMCIIKQLNADTGEIHRLAHTGRDPARQMPRKLSQTGLFTDLRTLEPAPFLVRYEVNSPLWSDRATKQRWIGLPAGRKITGDWSGTWRFPIGTVFVKHFELPLDECNAERADTMDRLETRVLVCDEEGRIYGGAYRWNDDRSEATLLDDAETEEIAYVDAEGGQRQQEWYYPGRFECLTCHNPQASYVLGFSARQLNRTVSIGSRSQNQLVRFAEAGMFAGEWADAQLTALPRLAPLDDRHATVEHRVRSYLDANCSHCHRPHVYTGLWDGRFEIPLDQQQIVGGQAIFHKINDPLASVVRAGDLEHSYLWKRMTSSASHLRMPPLGRNLVHDEAAALIAEWIHSLPPAHAQSPSKVAQAPESVPLESKR